MSSRFDLPTVGYFIDHMFFPPRIDTSGIIDVGINTSQSELSLLSFVHEAVSQYPGRETLTDPTAIKRMDRVAKMLEVMTELQTLPPGSDELQTLLMKTYAGMEEDDIVTFHLKVHNAAIMFFHRGSAIIFYSFEVSLPTSDVIQTSHRLRCCYPHTATSIPISVFYRQDFLEELTKLLSMLSAATIISQPSCALGTRSERHRLNGREDDVWIDYNLRDEPNPRYITEFLTGILRGIGKGVNLGLHEVMICKRIADDALFAGPERKRGPLGYWKSEKEKRTERPPDYTWTNTWRRSPIWLVIRVALQISLRNTGSGGHCGYKLLILHILTKLLELGNQLELSSDKLSHMSTKATRRAAKIEAEGVLIPNVLAQYLTKTTQCALDVLEKRFQQIRLATVRELVCPQIGESEAHRDVQLRMAKSRKYIEDVLQEYREKTEIRATVIQAFSHHLSHRIYHDTSRFQAIFQPIPENLRDYSPLGSSPREIWLKDIEYWVETTLEDFVAAHIGREKACCQLYELLASYADQAGEQYRNKPLENSLKLLTLAELWVALDRIATSIIPLLKEYPCEVNPSFLMDLLLPTNTQLKRAQNVLTYLESRRSQATSSSIFTHYRKVNEQGTLMLDFDTFSVRYFDQSPGHQVLLDTIEGRRQALTLDQCAIDETELVLQRQSASYCELERKAKAIVFELDLPVAFAKWRDATYTAALYFPVHRSRTDLSRTNNQDPELTPDPLATYYVSKSQVLSCEIKVSTRQTSRRVEGKFNDWAAVKCRYLVQRHDVSDTPNRPRGWRTQELLDDGSLRRVRSECTFWCPVKWNCEWTPNSVICEEFSESPRGWPRHEYYACAMLQVGFRLRWLNILREMKAGNFPLNQIGVLNLILQASWQTGPLDSSKSDLPETHEILHDVDFCNQMLDVLQNSLTIIKQNWLQQTSMQLIVALGARVLSLAHDRQVKARAVYFLRVCRAACMEWLLDIFRHMNSCSDGGNPSEWHARVVGIAAICRQTFDVDPGDLLAIFNSERDLGDFLECAACIDTSANKNYPDKSDLNKDYLDNSDGKQADDNHETLVLKDSRLAHRIEPHLRDLIFTNNSWFHSAIARIVPGYIVGGQWHVLPAPHDRWITTKSGGDVPLRVHYDLLGGTILIDGLPFAALPPRYCADPLYTEIFSPSHRDRRHRRSANFVVVKADMPGMDYRMVESVSSDPTLIVYFGMRNDKLIIRTKRGNSVHEIIPRDELVGDFPDWMLQGHIHFLDLNQQKLDFRSRSFSESSNNAATDESLWSPSNRSFSWVVTISEPDWTHGSWSPRGQRTLSCGREVELVDYYSPTHAAFAAVLRSIVDKSCIELSLSRKDGKLYVSLPRYKPKLEFEFDVTVTQGNEIACRTFPGMVVDLRPRVGQDMQTLYGLKTYLILREAGLAPPSARRTAIIPQGSFECVAAKYNTWVTIKPKENASTGYYVYSIDSLLGRLITDGDVGSFLHKTYLHALTSYCLPDPLTGLMGTQQALDDLRSARLWTVWKSHEVRWLMIRISELSPRQEVISANTHVDGAPLTVRTRKIKWRPELPSFSQLGEFSRIAGSTLQRWENIDENTNEGVPCSAGDYAITEVECREVAYLANDYGGNLHSSTRQQDKIHTQRKIGPWEERVCHISRLTNQWTINLQPTPRLNESVQQWKWPASGNSESKRIAYDCNLHRASLAEYGCALYEFCRKSTQENDKYKLLFVLSTFAYFDEAHIPMVLLEAILAFATNPIFTRIPLAPIRSGWRRGYEWLWLKRSGNDPEKQESRKKRLWAETVQVQLNRISDRTKASPPMPRGEMYHVITPDHIECSPRPEIETMKGFRGLLYTRSVPTVHTHIDDHENTLREPRVGFTTAGDFTMTDPRPLEKLLKRFYSTHPGGFHRSYFEELKKSSKAFRQLSVMNRSPLMLPEIDLMESYMRRCLVNMHEILKMIVETLAPGPDDTVGGLLVSTGLVPRISPTSILAQLRGMNVDSLEQTPAWKETFVLFAKSVTLYQRSTRLYRATHCGDLVQFTKEWDNRGHVDWDPLEFPEWLLFEIENDLLIRPIQAKIAMQMMTPHTNRNALMQLGMGEGKSAVIVPLVATALADRRKFVRVLVLDSLCAQMFTLLTQKLSGLLNRRIYYAPFSRETGLNHWKCSKIFQECMNNQGIFVTVPDHLLSFKLTGVESILHHPDPDSTSFTGEAVQIHRWLHSNARDIFDESDELLHPRYELIYTIGAQQPLELGAERWSIIQEMFTLVGQHMRLLKNQFPHGISLIDRQDAPGSFPVAQLLEQDAEVMLMREIAPKITRTELERWLNLKHTRGIDDHIYDKALGYVIDEHVKEDEVLTDLGEVPLFLLLLKGLIGHGIIAFTLREKRWRVDYGLHDSSKVAIPYRAKDTPVIHAQFAHPDIGIALTCLSYYYEGLTESQLRLCFQHIKRLSDPEGEYCLWITECKTYLPRPLWHLCGVNLQDTNQWLNIVYPSLKLVKKIIDFYLAVDLFPSECKEFPAKLSTSAWDLAEERTHVTTGFSGTSDSQYLLPISIQQLGAGSNAQAHTNAKVLSYLLQPENRFYQCAQTDKGDRIPGKELLSTIVNRPPAGSRKQIQVLLDVGAQLLDMPNECVARYWLSLAIKKDTKWTAALFVNLDGELAVIGKDGGVQPFISSPYVGVMKNMASCLVYLDEAHTRGTDIKLPPDSMAAVTLGPKLTKDKLVQGCMRMRNLGYGQSVCFFAPPDIHQRILAYSNKTSPSSPDTQINIMDVLCWAMHETCIQTEKSMALWASQGITYQTRQSGWEAYITGTGNHAHFTAAWKEVECKSLESMYSTSSREANSIMCIIDQKLQNHQLRGRKVHLEAIKIRCEENKIRSIREASLQEQQEREVLRETVQKDVKITKKQLPKVKARPHALHSGLTKFIVAGLRPLPAGTVGSPFCTLQDSLKKTSFGKEIWEELWSSRVLATIDFSFTVDSSGSIPRSNVERYLRPVNWILSTCALHDDGQLTLILISPFEANELMPLMRKSEFVNLHMYSAKIRKSGPSFYDLTAGMIIPPLVGESKWRNKFSEREKLIIQVNLYAGELFFGSYDIYRKTCAYLGISVEGGERPSNELRGRKSLVSRCEAGRGTFQVNSWTPLVELVNARVNGWVRFEETDLNCLLQGTRLEEREWVGSEDEL